MVMLQPLAVALRSDNYRRNILVQSRGIPADDIGKCSGQLMGQLLRAIPSSQAGPDLITGTQCASLTQGVYEALGRRYVVVWKILNDVMIVSIVPTGTNVLTAHRVNGAVAQLLLLYCKSTAAVTQDRIFRKYVQVHAALGTLVRENGQDHQRAFLEGEGIMGLLQPGTSAPKAKALLGLANKDKAHAATRAGDRALQEVLDQGARARGLGGSAPAAERAAAAAAVTLPSGVASSAAAATIARSARVVATEDGFTRPELVKADAEGELAGLAQHVALPGFQMPEEVLPNRLADPEGKLRRGPGGELIEEETEEEEEEEEEEVTEEEDEEVVSPGPKALPGLWDTSDVSLLEKWHACFVGPRLHAASTHGQVLCNVPDITCLVKLEVPQLSAVVDAVERARGHRASFAKDPATAAAEAAAAEEADTESEYSEDLDAGGRALQLAVRSGGPVGTGLVAEGSQRSVLEYQLPAAGLPPPFLGCLEVNDAPSRVVDDNGVPEWEMLLRVRLQASHGLPCATVAGTLVVQLPKDAPPLCACTPLASYVEAKQLISFEIPPMASGVSFEAKARFSGKSSLTGPDSKTAVATVRLFGTPGEGTLTGTGLRKGNTVKDMESNLGNYLCHIKLQPAVTRFKLPSRQVVVDDAEADIAVAEIAEQDIVDVADSVDIVDLANSGEVKRDGEVVA